MSTKKDKTTNSFNVSIFGMVCTKKNRTLLSGFILNKIYKDCFKNRKSRRIKNLTSELTLVNEKVKFIIQR